MELVLRIVALEGRLGGGGINAVLELALCTQWVCNIIAGAVGSWKGEDSPCRRSAKHLFTEVLNILSIIQLVDLWVAIAKL